MCFHVSFRWRQTLIINTVKQGNAAGANEVLIIIGLIDYDSFFLSHQYTSVESVDVLHFSLKET